MRAASRIALWGAALASLLMVVGAAQARRQGLSVTDITAITDGEGSYRILFRLQGLDRLQGAMIRRAAIRIPHGATDLDRPFEVRVCPVTTTWAADADWDRGWDTPGGDFDHELYGRATVHPDRAGAMVLDITVPLKEMVEHDRFADGFILTAVSRGRDAIDSDELLLFQSLGTAEVEVEAKTLLSQPPEGRRQRR